MSKFILIYINIQLIQHLVVFCGGNIYMLPVTNSRGKFLSVLDLESQMEWIVADAKHSDGEKRLLYHSNLL